MTSKISDLTALAALPVGTVLQEGFRQDVAVRKVRNGEDGVEIAGRFLGLTALDAQDFPMVVRYRPDLPDQEFLSYDLRVKVEEIHRLLAQRAHVADTLRGIARTWYIDRVPPRNRLIALSETLED